MEKNHFSLWQALRFGLYTLVEHFGFYILVTASYFATLIGTLLVAAGIGYGIMYHRFAQFVHHVEFSSYSFQWIISSLKSMDALVIVLGIAFILGFLLLMSFLLLGVTRIALDLYDKNTSSLGRLFSCADLTISAFLATLCYVFMVIGGLILFVLPGIYLAIRYLFYLQVIVDRQVGPCKALSISAQITKGAQWRILALGILMACINMVFKSPFFIFFWPFTSLVWVYVYRQLSALQRPL